MNVKFKLCDIGNHLIRVEGLTQIDDEFIDDNVTSNLTGLYARGRFKYKLTMTVTIVEYTSTKETKVVYSNINDHCSYLDETYITLPKDGIYTISLILLPTKEWYDQEIKEEFNIFDINPKIIVYFTDGINIYKSIDKNIDIVNNWETELLRGVEGTTLSKASKLTFYIKYLKECYMFYCKSILNQSTFKCIEKNISLKDFIWKRDFVWMAINAIKFYTEEGNLEEAQRLLELLNYCGGFCNKHETSQKLSDCGCSKN